MAFNQEILQRAGQASALLRERGLLESAVLRPQNAAYYEGADVITQAALYMVGIALNHPITDWEQAHRLYQRHDLFCRSTESSM